VFVPTDLVARITRIENAMKSTNCRLLVAMFTLLATGPVRAAKLGDPAPPLKIASWIKGDAVDLAKGKGKNIYVIEFWATWCPPCVQSIPHITAQQKKLKDKGVVFIGVTGEPAGIVKTFVKRMSDRMAYTVAADDKGQTTSAYMAAFGQRGIPHCFVIDKAGRIAWHGYPAEELDAVIEKMLAGSYDLDAIAKENQLRAMAGQYLSLASKDNLSKQAINLGNYILIEGATNKSLLNDFAWYILAHPDIKNRDHKLALRAAKIAFKLSDGEDPSVSETYGRALFETGNLTQAIDVQKLAVKFAANAAHKANYEKVLQRYKEAILAAATTQPSAKAE
jgi:peroxiredoxin